MSVRLQESTDVLYHPHLHAVVSDGLFSKKGTLYVMRNIDLKSLEELFRAEVSVAHVILEKVKIINKLINSFIFLL